MSEFELKINEEVENRILAVSRWSRILGSIFVLFLILFFLISLMFTLDLDENDDVTNNYQAASFFFTLALFMFLPSFYAFKMSSYLKRAILNTTQIELENGLTYISNFFKAILGGILALIVVFYFIFTYF